MEYYLLSGTEQDFNLRLKDRVQKGHTIMYGVTMAFDHSLGEMYYSCIMFVPKPAD